MKHILKNPEPQTFSAWKTNWPDEIKPGWAEFDSGSKQADGSSAKQKIKAALLAEQGGICCFCETGVDTDFGHIAHLQAQADYPDLVLDYGNLLYSCPENPRTSPQCCGHAQKRNKLPISPLDPDCECRFKYTSTGSIIPSSENDQEAVETIRILNLDDRRLVQRGLRAVIFEEIDVIRREIPPEEFEIWINKELERQPDGRFKPFWTTRKYAAGLYT